MNKDLTKKFKNIVVASFLVFFFSFGVASACATIPSYRIVALDENGSFSFPKEVDALSTIVDVEKYPGTVEIYINNEKLQPTHEAGNLGKYVSSENNSVSVKQNGKEIYSAKWRIYHPWSKKNILQLILLTSAFITLSLIIWGIISSLFGKKERIDLKKTIGIFIGIDFLLCILIIFLDIC